MNKLVSMFVLVLMSTANANAATWTYAGTVTECGVYCGLFGISSGDTVTGYVTLDTGANETGYIFNPATDDFGFSIAGSGGPTTVVQTDLASVDTGAPILTDAGGDLIQGFVGGPFINPGTALDFLGGGSTYFDLASGRFEINIGVPFLETAAAEGAFTLQAVPIPAAAWLFGSALIGLGLIKRKKA